MRRFSLAAALAWCSLALADTASLTWTYPTRNVDGSALVDLADFRVFRRCDAAPLAVLATVPASTPAPNGGESSGYVDAAPAGETCWYSVTARNAGGEESARTGEVSKTFAADLPGDVSASFTWQILDEPEPPDVGTYSEDFSGQSTSAPPSGWTRTHNTSFPWATDDVVSEASAIGGKWWKLQDSTGQGTDERWRWDTPGSVDWSGSNVVQMLLGFRVGATGTDGASIFLPLMLNITGTRYLGADIQGTGNSTLRCGDFTSSNAWGVGTAAAHQSSFAADSLVWLRVEVSATEVKARLWDDGDTEDTSWHCTKTLTPTETSGYVGLMLDRTLDPIYIEYISVGTNGDDAPGPSGGVGATVNRASETDTAQAIARSKSKAIGQAAESDFAQAAARYKARVAALAAETDTARAVGKAKARTAGQAAESDTSRTITPAGAPVGGTVTQALETDSARTLSSSKAKAIGQAAELDLVQTILRVKARAVGQALEGDSARPISLPGSIGGTLSQAIESDLARSVGKAKAKAIAQALETDAGRAIAAMRAYAVGRASETDAAIAVAAIGKALALGVATEQDIARAFTVSGGAPVDFYYLREALEMAAASIIAALANTTVTVDVGGAGETSGVVAIQQERSFDPGLPGLRMASTSTEFLLEKKTAPASLKQGTLIRDETSSETYRVRRLNYNRGGIVTVEIERV